MQKRVEGEELIGKEKERTTYSEVIIGIPLIFKIVIKRYETHRTQALSTYPTIKR